MDYIQNPCDLGAIGDGIYDCTTEFIQALSILDEMGGGKLIAPHSKKGYKLSKQLKINDNIEFDLNGSTIIQAGELIDSTKRSVVLIHGSGNTIKNVKFNCMTGQHGIEFSPTSKNNLEYNCSQRNTSGLKNLIKIESENPNAKTNISMTLLANSKSKPYKRLKKWDVTINLSALKTTSIQCGNFPSECKIKRIVVKNSLPNVSFLIYSDNNMKNLFYSSEIFTDGFDKLLDLDYFKGDMDDRLELYIRNHNVSNNKVTIEIYFEEERYHKFKKLWQYNSVEDFYRPHKDNQGIRNIVSKETIKSVEFRYRTQENPLAMNVISATPFRDVPYVYNSLIIPTPQYQTQKKDFSQLKFYFDFSASNACVVKPTQFVFTLENLPKHFKGDLITGWISQNKDGDVGYLQQSMIYHNANPRKIDISNSFGEIVLNLDPKGYQLGSIFEEEKSFDFFYFIFETNDPNFAVEFGEKYSFNAYFK